MSGTFLAEFLAGWVTVTGSLRSGTDVLSFPVAFLVALLLQCATGFSEELLFRGYLLQNLAEGFHVRALGPRTAVVLALVLSSSLFGFAISGDGAGESTSLLGLAAAGVGCALTLVWIRLRGRPISIDGAIGCHAPSPGTRPGA